MQNKREAGEKISNSTPTVSFVQEVSNANIRYSLTHSTKTDFQFAQIQKEPSAVEGHLMTQFSMSPLLSPRMLGLNFTWKADSNLVL